MRGWFALLALGTQVLLVAASSGDTLRFGDADGRPGDERPTHSYEPPDGFSETDSLYLAGRLAEARERCLGKESAEFPALWRLARVESDMAQDSTGEAQKQLFAWAEQHARAAVRVAPDSAGSHEWLAVVLGRKALKEGPKTRLAYAREIKAEADRALELNPNSARAWHVLGRWNRELASLNFMERLGAGAMGGIPKGASMENAVRDLERAVALDPGFINHHLELGRTYLQLHRKEDARRELERAQSLTPGASPRDARYQKEARELLSRLPAPR